MPNPYHGESEYSRLYGKRVANWLTLKHGDYLKNLGRPRVITSVLKLWKRKAEVLVSE